ncbi:MAG TPA: class A beta-lactamase [Pyrinomonadaceae bacterium]|nr:class A beta-lactamase [Pyrinomonadaceae bacterium]
MGSSQQQTVYAPTPQPPLAPLVEKTNHQLEAQIAMIAEEAKGRVGVGAVMLETGDAAWLDRHGHFPSQSVYKLPIAMAALKMVDDARLRLGQDAMVSREDFVRQGFHSPIRNLNPSGTVLPVLMLLHYSISESDGTANDVLLDLVGGPPAVQSYLTSLGVTDFIVADSTKSISKDWETQYRNWATPEDSIKLLRTLQDRVALSEESTDLLLEFMKGSDIGGRRLKRGIPEGATVAHKTGTGGTKDGLSSATNDIGIITLPDGRHIAIAVYISDSSADGYTRQRVIADIAKAVCEKWVAKG